MFDSKIPKNSGLFNCLAEVKLEKLHENFVKKGVTTCEKLATISIVDFESYGVTSMNDRLRLFQLIQIIKSVILKSFNKDFKDRLKQRRPQATRVISDDSLSYRSKSLGKLNKFIENIEHLEDGTNNLLYENWRKPFSSTSEGTLTLQEQVVDILGNAKINNLKKESFDINILRTGLLDLNNSKNSNFYLKPFERSFFLNNNIRARNSKNSLLFTKEQSILSNDAKFMKKDKTNDYEKTSTLKETLYTSSYNYGVPQQKGIIRSQEKAYSVPMKKGMDISDGKPNPDKVKVCVRKRPRNAREIAANDPDVVQIEGKTKVIVEEQKTALNLTKYIHQHVMTFDEIFDETQSNVEVYKTTVKPLVTFVLKKGTAICFSFGQTGAGKTHTLIGDKSNPGLYQLAGRDIFDFIQRGGDANVWVSFYEIYCGQLFDLLNNRKKLILMEKSNRQVCVTGLMETCATDLRSLIHIINFGRIHRSKGCSGVNPVSSRSHAVLQLDVRSTGCNKRIGRLTFIDLAGSERASDAMKCNKQTRYEGAEINQSLLALKECIRSLDQEQSHTPYRQSKLTHILRESFSGNCQTVMIANISPTLSACENTLNTLRYADRVQELKKASQQKIKIVTRKYKDSDNVLSQSTDTLHPLPLKDLPTCSSEGQNSHVHSPIMLLNMDGIPRNTQAHSNLEFNPPSTKDVSSVSSSRCSKSSKSGTKTSERNTNLHHTDKLDGHRKEFVQNTDKKERKSPKKEYPADKTKGVLSGATKIGKALFNNYREMSMERSSSVQPGVVESLNKKLHGCRAKDRTDSQTILLVRSSQDVKKKSPHKTFDREGKIEVAMKHLQPLETNTEKELLPSKNRSKKSSIENSNELPEELMTRLDKELDLFSSKDLAPSDSAARPSKNALGSILTESSKEGGEESLRDLINSLRVLSTSQDPETPSDCFPDSTLDSATLLINAHEKHLDSVTQLCREEINLLMKLRSGQMPFPSYVSKIRGIMATRKIMSDALIDHIGQFDNYVSD